MNSSELFSAAQFDWAFAFGRPEQSAKLRAVPEDFQVDEDLGFAPDGEGEHVLLRVRKRNANTDWVARELANFAGVPQMNVSYAGLKDRNAVTMQWFSVQLGKQPEPAWDTFAPEGVTVLEAARHRKKLRRGTLTGNHFTLILRELSGECETLLGRLEKIREEGVPNYFGEQRFGHDRGNIEKAVAVFEGRMKERNRTKRGLYLSSARSFLFNRVLSSRVEDGTWNQALPGDCLILDGSRSFFLAEEIDATLLERLARGDVHPSGPLWGRGELPCRGVANALEQSLLEPYAALRTGLENEGMNQERRSLRLPVRKLEWNAKPEGIQLSFWLPAGTFATAVLRELVAAA